MRDLLRKQQVGLMALAAAFVAVVLYWPSLKLPVIYDSLLHIRIARGLNFATVWLPTDKFSFYRPMTFLPLLFIRDLFGDYPAWLLHGLNVGQHALNVALLVALSWRLWRKRSWALAAGLLLALFPFSYQAIAVYGHNVHPSTAGLILLGLHTYLNGVRERKMGWWILTGFLFALGLFSHETAVLFGFLAALVHWNGRRQNSFSTHKSRIMRDILPWSVFLILGGLYALIYQLLPISRAVPGADADGGLWLKALYLMQAVAHPVTWFAHLWPDLGANTAVLGGMALVLALTAWSARRRFHRLPLLLGWAWCLGASFLLLVSLPSAYLLHGPRLLYLGGVGLALLWPILLEPLTQVRAGRLLWTAVLGFVLLSGWGFVRQQLERYVQLTGPVGLVEEVMADRPPAEGILLINLPAWLSPPTNTYPVGAEHVAALGYHLFAEELVAVNLGVKRPVLAIKLPELLRDPGYPYTVFGETDLSQPILADWAPAGSQVFVVSHTGEGVASQAVGQLGRMPEGRPVAQFGSYPLFGAEALACDEAVDVTTSWGWIDDQLPPGTLSLFVQLLDDSGQLVAQADSPPLGLRFNLIAPAPGWLMVDRRKLEPASGAPAQLLIGMYDYLDSERLSAIDGRQNPLPDNALRVPIENCPQVDGP